MHNLIKRLEKRGWEKKEIQKAVSIIANIKKNKPNDIRFLEKRIYWILLVVIVTANFAISTALMPVLMTLKGTSLYLIIILIGFTFGLLFELVIRSIEHLKKKHHVILAILIPLVGLVNFFVMSWISNGLIRKLELQNFQNPLSIAIAYSASFVIPYIVYRFILKVDYYIKE